MADREIHGPQQLRWFDHLEYEHDNLRATLPWALESKQADAGLRLAGELGFFWLVRGYLNEGIGWLERTLAQESEVSKVVAAKAYRQLGSLYMGGVERNPDRGLNVLERSLNLYQELEGNSGIAWVLNLLGLVAMEHNDYQKAKQFLSQSMILRHELGDPWSIAHTLQNFAPLALQENNYAGAKQITEETITWFRQAGRRSMRNCPHFVRSCRARAPDRQPCPWDCFTKTIPVTINPFQG